MARDPARRVSLVINLIARMMPVKAVGTGRGEGYGF
jgi:hypothetical protein